MKSWIESSFRSEPAVQWYNPCPEQMSTLGWVLVGMGVTERRRKADREKFRQREEQTAHMQHNSHPSLPSLKRKKNKKKNHLQELMQGKEWGSL